MDKLLRLFFCIIFIASSGVLAQPKRNVESFSFQNKPELTLCTQNLLNYGTARDVSRRIKGFSEVDLYDKEQALITRFLEAKCDVIAVQELLGGTEQLAKEALQMLAKLLKDRTNRTFTPIVGPSNDKVARVGFLVATDRATLVNKISYSRVELPKIAEEQKTRYFIRGPLEIELIVNAKDGEGTKKLVLVTFHFKSRAFNNKDPVDLEWETYRMEMAEALRRIIVGRHEKDYKRGVKLLVILGDRNSHYDTGSAKLLDGTLTLADFQGDAPCRLSKRGMPLCSKRNTNGQEFFSVLTLDPETQKLPGTYRFQNTFSWLDDILLPARSLGFVRADSRIEGNFDSGVIYEPKLASDHALAYVRLNW